jgi:hypothetical protein
VPPQFQGDHESPRGSAQRASTSQRQSALAHRQSLQFASRVPSLPPAVDGASLIGVNAGQYRSHNVSELGRSQASPNPDLAPIGPLLLDTVHRSGPLPKHEFVALSQQSDKICVWAAATRSAMKGHWSQPRSPPPHTPHLIGAFLCLAQATPAIFHGGYFPPTTCGLASNGQRVGPEVP